MFTSTRGFAVTLAAALAWASAAPAQEYPAKPIRVVVATAAGGLMDVAARLTSDYLDRGLGQRVLVENRGGAGGNLGAEAVAKAAPDGYTLGLIQLGNVAINPYLYGNLSFDPLNDLAPVAPLTSSTLVVTVSSKLPASNLREFIDMARRMPGKLNHGSAGIGTVPHFGGVLFEQRAGVAFTHVHYRGAGPAVTDLIAGQVQVVFVGLGAVRGHLASGALKALAVAQNTRLKAAPDIPTAEEAGLPGFEFNTWFGVVAPKGTPASIVAALSRQIHAMQDDPAAQKRLSDGGLEVLKESPEQFRAHMLRDHERFRDIVKAANLKAE